MLVSWPRLPVSRGRKGQEREGAGDEKEGERCKERREGGRREGWEGRGGRKGGGEEATILPPFIARMPTKCLTTHVVGCKPGPNVTQARHNTACVLGKGGVCRRLLPAFVEGGWCAGQARGAACSTCKAKEMKESRGKTALLAMVTLCRARPRAPLQTHGKDRERRYKRRQ